MEKKYILICFLLSMIISSCGNKTSYSEEETVYKSQSYKLIEDNINQMVNNPWNKATYNEIKNVQIPMLKKNSERLSAATLLETEYSKLLVRDANKILCEGCNSNNSHNLLLSLMKELISYPKVPGLTELTSVKKLHDEVLSFANSGVGKQTISSYRTPYDKSYETKKMSTAKSYLDNSKVKCKIARSKLTNLSQTSAYEYRRRAYCESVTKLYLQSTNASMSELNAAKASLNIYSGDKSAWKKQMDEHYNQLNTIKQ